MVKMKDIAEKLGVGVSTVSAVLNKRDYCYISAQKRELIERTAKEMGYMPNHLIRAMHGLPTKTIGIIGSLFYVSVNSMTINLIQRELYKSGYFIFLGDSQAEPDVELNMAKEFLARGADGLIVETCYDGKSLLSLSAGRVPVVFFSSDKTETTVSTDRRLGASMAVSHLSSIGRKKIAYLGHKSVPNQEKVLGYLDALKKIRQKDKLVFESEHATERVFDLCGMALSGGADAIFTSNDRIAALCMLALKEWGKHVPDDISVMGFDGSEICDLVSPSISTIRQPVELVAKEVTKQILDLLGGKEIAKERRLFKPEIKIGDSCGCKREKFV